LGGHELFSGGVSPVLILDRGYARVSLFMHLRQEGIPFLCRATRAVMVYLNGNEKTLGRVLTSESF
jgi:hypothetical protein